MIAAGTAKWSPRRTSPKAKAAGKHGPHGTRTRPSQVRGHMIRTSLGRSLRTGIL